MNAGEWIGSSGMPKRWLSQEQSDDPKPGMRHAEIPPRACAILHSRPRENSAHYKAFFEVGNKDIGLENAYFWDLNPG